MLWLVSLIDGVKNNATYLRRRMLPFVKAHSAYGIYGIYGIFYLQIQQHTTQTTTSTHHA